MNGNACDFVISIFDYFLAFLFIRDLCVGAEFNMFCRLNNLACLSINRDIDIHLSKVASQILIKREKIKRVIRAVKKAKGLKKT